MRGFRFLTVAVVAAVVAAVAALTVVPARPVAAASPAAETAWAFDPAGAGGDRPPVGRSLFDSLFVAARDGAKVHDVPFPFAALRRRLRDMGRVKETLIPLGRALQRDAAAPDFFRFPRVVLAVDGESPASGPARGPILRDRLFIGYQERAESLEVIGYNEAAGRFEFQVVKDYAPGKTPRVVYANRRLCLACHQNGGPVFSEPLWSETNANPEIGRRLLAAAPSFHGVPAYSGERTVAQPFAIADSVDRANLFSASQTIWRRGCGGAASEALAIGCRAAILTLALQYRLSGDRHFDSASELYAEDLAAPLTAAWRRLWPNGLAIPDPRVPDRDPLLAGGTVPAALDPLSPRPPLEVWSAEDPETLERAVEGLSRFISDGDVGRLDAHLRESGRPAGAPRIARESPCAVSRRIFEDWRERFVFRCEDHETGGLSVNGYFYVAEKDGIAGVVPRVILAGGVVFEELSVSAEAVTTREGRSRVVLRPRIARTGLHPRMPDGSAIESIELRWAAAIEEDFGPSDEIPVYRDNGRLIVTTVQDFAPLGEAVAALARAARGGRTDALSDKPFRRTVVMGGLFAHLGLDWNDGRRAPASLPPPLVETPEPRPMARDPGAGEVAAGMAAFDAFCGTCHDTADPFPPNFLGGAPERRRAAVARCGERIAFRLAMWEGAAEGRAKSPMPPLSWLRSIGIDPAAWRESSELASLRRVVGGGRSERPYDELPPCLEDRRSAEVEE